MKVIYLANQETKQKVFDAVINWCNKHKIYAGEVLMQSDTGTIEAPVLLSDIIDDIIKFEVEYEDED